MLFPDIVVGLFLLPIFADENKTNKWRDENRSKNTNRYNHNVIHDQVLEMNWNSRKKKTIYCEFIVNNIV